MVFAYAVSVGELTYCVNEESAILVTVSDELNIVIPATATATASYIDIDINGIGSATIEINESQSQSSSSLPTYIQVLTIWMPKSLNGKFYVNARSHSADSINLAFTSSEAASRVQQSLLKIRPSILRDIQASQLSEAEPIDVSNHPRQTAGPTIARLATPGAGVPLKNLVNAAIEQDSITSKAPPPLRKVDHEHQLNHLSQSGEQFRVPPRQGPLLETSPNNDMVSLVLHQPTEFDGSMATIEHDILRTPKQKIRVEAEQCSLSKDYVAFRGGNNFSETLPLEQCEDLDKFYRVRPSAQHLPTKQANRSSLRLCNVSELHEPAGTALVPDVNRGNSSEQSGTKMIHRRRKTIGELSIGPSVNGGASDADEKRVENPKSALKRKAPFPDKRDAESYKIRRFQSEVNPEIGYRTVSANVQDGAEFDFPTSAHKSQESKTACLPTLTRASKVPNSHKTAKKPQIKATPPSRLQPKGLSTRYQVQTHEKETCKEVSRSITSLPSRYTRDDTEDSGTGQTDTNVELIVDEAKKSNKAQHESKKPLKRKSQSKPKHAKDVGDLAYSTKKAQNAPIKKSKRKSKAVPIPLAQSRKRRRAALTANEKIQNLIQSEASVEEDLVEVLSKKEKFTARDHKSGTSTSDLSISASEESSAANRNSRPSLLGSGEDEWQIMENGQEFPMTKILQHVVSRSEESPRAESSKNASILANNLAQLIGGLPADDTTDTWQSLRGTASNVKPFEGYNVHHAQMPNAQLNMPPRQVNEVQDSVSDENQEHLERQDVILQNNLLHSNVSFPSGDSNSAVVPEVSAPNNIDALDGAGGSFFEEATAFSHEDATSVVDKIGDKKTSKALALEDKHESDHDNNRLKNLNSDPVLRAAGTSTNVAISTPKFPIAAKLQSALSSVESRHVQTTSQETPRRLEASKATMPSEAKDPALNTSVHKMTIRRGEDKFIQPKIQVIKPAIAQTNQDVMKNKAVPDPDMQFLDPKNHSNPESAAIAEHGKSSNDHIINETSPKLNQEPLPSARIDQVAQTPVVGIGERCPEETIAAAAGVRGNKHSLVGNLTRDTSATGKVDKAPSSKSQAASFKKAGSAEIPIGARLDVNRKSNIISFDSKGPKNQGTLSAQKAKAIQVPDTNAPLSRMVEDRRLKRKLQDLDADEFALEQYVAAGKRPRASEDVPQTREEAPKIMETRKDSVIKESMRKSSSQSTRVDPNGSPMPFVHARKATLRGPNFYDSIDANQLAGGRQDNDYEDDGFMLEGRFDDSKLGLPFSKVPSSPSAASIHSIPSSSNKRRPTSPNAPCGIIDEYAAHQVCSRGKFVDLQTDNIVTAVRPPDPFVGVQRDPTNDFINRLRRLSDNPGKKNNPVRGAANNEDSEKTLIETSSVQKKHGPSSSSSSSSSSDGSQSNNSSPSEDPSSSEGGDDEYEWAKALKPHHGHTLEVLYEISHVSQICLLASMSVIISNKIKPVASGSQHCVQRSGCERHRLRLQNWWQSPCRSIGRVPPARP